MEIIDELKKQDEINKLRIEMHKKREIAEARNKKIWYYKGFYDKRKKVLELLDSENKDLDEPIIYDVINRKYKETMTTYCGPSRPIFLKTFLGSFIGTKRKYEMMNFLKDNNYGFSIKPSKVMTNEYCDAFSEIGTSKNTYTIREPENGDEKRCLEVEKEKNELIKESDDKSLDEKGVLYFYYEDGTKDWIETTMRKALLVLGKDNLSENFKTYRQILEDRKAEIERKREEDKKMEESKKEEQKKNEERNNKISLKSIKSSIKKAFGRKEK